MPCATPYVGEAYCQKVSELEEELCQTRSVLARLWHGYKTGSGKALPDELRKDLRTELTAHLNHRKGYVEILVFRLKGQLTSKVGQRDDIAKFIGDTVSPGAPINREIDEIRRDIEHLEGLSDEELLATTGDPRDKAGESA